VRQGESQSARSPPRDPSCNTSPGPDPSLSLGHGEKVPAAVGSTPSYRRGPLGEVEASEAPPGPSCGVTVGAERKESSEPRSRAGHDARWGQGPASDHGSERQALREKAAAFAAKCRAREKTAAVAAERKEKARVRFRSGVTRTSVLRYVHPMACGHFNAVGPCRLGTSRRSKTGVHRSSGSQWLRRFRYRFRQRCVRGLRSCSAPCPLLVTPNLDCLSWWPRMWCPSSSCAACAGGCAVDRRGRPRLVSRRTSFSPACTAWTAASSRGPPPPRAPTGNTRKGNTRKGNTCRGNNTRKGKTRTGKTRTGKTRTG